METSNSPRQPITVDNFTREGDPEKSVLGGILGKSELRGLRAHRCLMVVGVPVRGQSCQDILWSLAERSPLGCVFSKHCCIRYLPMVLEVSIRLPDRQVSCTAATADSYEHWQGV